MSCGVTWFVHILRKEKCSMRIFVFGALLLGYLACSAGCSKGITTPDQTVFADPKGIEDPKPAGGPGAAAGKKKQPKPVDGGGPSP
jgi:hypothetical protein